MGYCKINKIFVSLLNSIICFGENLVLGHMTIVLHSLGGKVKVVYRSAYIES